MRSNPVLIACSALLLAACHDGREGHMPELPKVLVVAGSGEVRARPDIAKVTLGVEAVDPNATAAIATMTTRMRAVIDSLKASGVQDADLQTNQFSIYSEQPPPPPYPAPMAQPSVEPRAATPTKASPPSAPPAPPQPVQPVTNYRVTNTVVATVRQVDRVGDILAAALAAGANQAGGIQFTLDNPKPLEDQARVKAMEDARHRAEDLARLGHVTLGKIVSVSEGGGPEPIPMAPYAMAKMASRDSSVPTEEGQVVVHQDVRLVFRIAE